MTLLRVHPRPRVLLICGNRNHTTTMHAIARELADCELWFTPYDGDDGSALDVLRRAGLLELVALGHGFRRRCLRYLTFRRDDRQRFIAWARELAGARPLVFRIHPDERMRRAVAIATTKLRPLIDPSHDRSGDRGVR